MCHSGVSLNNSIWGWGRPLLIFDLHLLVGTGNLSGVISERDYVTKIALLERSSKDVKVKEISTKAANLITARPEETTE